MRRSRGGRGRSRFSWIMPIGPDSWRDRNCERPGERPAPSVVFELTVRFHGPVPGGRVEGNGLGLFGPRLEPHLGVARLGRPLLQKGHMTPPEAATADGGIDVHTL